MVHFNLRGSEDAFSRFFRATHESQDRTPDRLCLVSASGPTVGDTIGVTTAYPVWVKLLAIAAGLICHSSDDSPEILRVADTTLKEGQNEIRKICHAAGEMLQLVAYGNDQGGKCYNQIVEATNVLGNDLSILTDQFVALRKIIERVSLKENR